MSGFYMFLMALFLPILMLLLLVAPIYAGMCGSLYLQYKEAVLPYLLDPLYVFKQYGALVAFAQKHMDTLSWGTLLSMHGCVALGAVIALGSTIWLIRYLRNYFLMRG